MNKIQHLVSLIMILFSFPCVGLEEIETIDDDPKIASRIFTQKSSINELINSNDKVFIVYSKDKKYSFQAYSLNENIIIEFMLVSFKLNQNEPFFVNYDVDCPADPSAILVKEWPINAKRKSIGYFLRYTTYDYIEKCTVMYGKTKTVSSWIKSIKFIFNEDFSEINNFLNDFGKVVLGYEMPPYYQFTEIRVP